jgi:hypothetical protein
MINTPLAKGSSVPENPAFFTPYLLFMEDKNLFELTPDGL